MRSLQLQSFPNLSDKYCSCPRSCRLSWHHVWKLLTRLTPPCPHGNDYAGLCWHLVRIVNDYTPTSCLCSQWLFQHVSPKSTTMPTRCPHSQRLHGHTILRKYQITFFVTFFNTFFLLFPKSNNLHDVCVVNDYAGMCLHSRWLCWHSVFIFNKYVAQWKLRGCVSAVKEYLDTRFLLISSPKKFAKLFLPVHTMNFIGAQVEFFEIQKCVENFVALSL